MRPRITSRNQKRYKIFCILSTITYGTRKTPTFQKQWKMCKNRKPLYVQRSKWDSLLDKNGTLISFWEEFTSVKNKHKKINFFVVFFDAKNDERENCQQRKALTSSPIRIAQFHAKSFFKSTKNLVKSHVFEQASVGVTNSNYKTFLETCCFKNRKKLLHSRKAANDKMSPQNPDPSHGPKLLKWKKATLFFIFWNDVLEGAGTIPSDFRNHGHRAWPPKAHKN